MTEQELRHAMHSAMTATQPPPPMNFAEVLDTAKRAHRRRRTTLAGAASAAAVVLIAVGAIVVASVTGGGTGPSPIEAGGPGVVPTERPGNGSGAPDTKTSWPDGQTDRTASQGPRYDKGVQLLDLLTTSVPAGLQSPTELKPVDGKQFHGDLRNHQAQFADEVSGKQVWEYMVSIPVGANGKWGKLLAEVHTAGNKVEGDGCALTATFWGMGGDCQLITVGDKQVGVAVRPTGDDRFDQWASYRHPDGTVVYVAQAKTYFMSGLPGLAELPLTPEQLAALVVDPKFRLD
jgi:hypothetical protein